MFQILDNKTIIYIPIITIIIMIIYLLYMTHKRICTLESKLIKVEESVNVNKQLISDHIKKIELETELETEKKTEESSQET